LFTLASVIGGVVFVGVTSFHLGEDDREWLSRAAAHFCMFTAAWLLLCSIVLLAPPYLFELPDVAKSAVAGVGGISGIVTAILGWSSRTTRQATPASESKPSLLAQWLPGVTMLAFVVVLMVLLSAASNWLVVSAHSVLAPLVGGEVHRFHWQEHDNIIVAGMLTGKLATVLTLLAISLIAGRFININRFSLHGMYRNRLVRAYLGASNRDRADKSGFTGFNPKDNVIFHKLQGQKPLHVVNAALNLVGGKRLDWQQRKAESFAFSPWYCGNSHTGYRNSKNYAGGVTLGSAVTISGAAASPNMGYHSSPLVGLVMMLFNARLGAWFGNPGEAGERTWTHDGPQSAVSPVVREAAGITTDSGEYVYLSDGGHFENLALYEMVMRRCRQIVVIDGGCDCDYTYEDLGNALRKIRIDFGIDIDFPNDFMAGLRKKEKRCAVARIRYSAAGEGPDGTLLYIKPVITGDESPDVLTYRSTSPTFPHESTSDQWFTEAQTESYRMLGLHTVESMTSGWKGENLNSFLDHACACYLSADTKNLTATAS
jgi:hypothetical protein